MKIRPTLALPMLVLTMGLLSTMPTAYADSITLTLTNPTQVAKPGSIVDFTATVSAPSSSAKAMMSDLNNALLPGPR